MNKSPEIRLTENLNYILNSSDSLKTDLYE